MILIRNMDDIEYHSVQIFKDIFIVLLTFGAFINFKRFLFLELNVL